MTTYKENTTSVEDIVEHFRSCAPEFQGYLSARVDVRDYAAKLIEKAFRYEAWDNGMLIGLVAIYHNSEMKSGFITSVSVSMGAGRSGVGSRLLQSCVDSAKAIGLKQIRLEVATNNTVAYRFYKRFGFVQENSSETNITEFLVLDLKG